MLMTLVMRSFSGDNCVEDGIGFVIDTGDGDLTVGSGDIDGSARAIGRRDDDLDSVSDPSVSLVRPDVFIEVDDVPVVCVGR